MTVANVRKLVAELNPRPPVPDSIRKLPTRASAPVSSEAPPAAAPLLPTPDSAPVAPSPLPPAPPPRPTLEPLAPDLYKIQFNANEELRDLLVLAQELLSHRKGRADLASVIQQGTELLVAKLKKEMYGREFMDDKRSSTSAPVQPATRFETSELEPVSSQSATRFETSELEPVSSQPATRFETSRPDDGAEPALGQQLLL